VTRADSSEARPASRTAGARPGFVFLYALAYAVLWLALLTPIIVTLALKVQQLAPGDTTRPLSLVFGVGAIFALVSNPLFGALSDRTTSRFGRRRPWLVGGILCGLFALAMIGAASNITTVLIGWCIAQLAFNATLAALVAVLPDQVPIAQRGTVAGILGVCMPVGNVAGTFLVQALPQNIWMALVVPGAIGTAGVLLFAFTIDDPPIGARPPASQQNFFSTYLIDPRQHPDFAWAWISRVFFVMGTATFQAYQPLFLMDHLGIAVHALPNHVFESTLLQSALLVISSAIGGRLSDRFGRRKIFVFAGSAVYGMGLWLIGTADSYSAFLIGVAATGIGQGTYVGVDLALFTDVLPRQKEDAAKDLGLVNVTNTLPQILSPAIAPWILAASDSGYAVLFSAAGLLCLFGSLAILPLKQVR